MADDIVTRLREHAKPKDWHTPGHPMNEWVDRRTTDRLCEHAADEIEQLRALADQLARALLDGPFRGDRRDRMYGSGWAEVHNALDAYEEACRVRT